MGMRIAMGKEGAEWKGEERESGEGGDG